MDYYLILSLISLIAIVVLVYFAYYYALPTLTQLLPKKEALELDKAQVYQEPKLAE